MIEPQLETPPLETFDVQPTDDLRATQLAQLMASPEVEVIGRMLANIERKRLGFTSVLRLDTLEPEATRYYREQAVMAIRLLDRDWQDEAIYAAAKVYAIKTYGMGLSELSEHKQGFCVWAARSVCNMFKHTISGHLPLSAAEARGWKILDRKMAANRGATLRSQEIP